MTDVQKISLNTDVVAASNYNQHVTHISERKPNTELIETPTTGYREENKQLDPAILSKWFQLLFNTIYMAILLGIIGYFIWIIKRDVDYKLEEVIRSEVIASKHCHDNYVSNECQNAYVVPALQEECNRWEECMHYDVIDNYKHVSGKLWAQTVAEIINAFFEPITIRSLIFITILVSSILLLTNMAFGSYRVYYYQDKHN